jgi:BASS family bile acid:Na+ symporter
MGVMFDGLEVLDNIRLNFSQGGLLILNFTLFFIMFGVALDIKLNHIKEVFIKPKAAIIGILSQFIALPAITFALVWLLREHITLGVALGMLLVASCPGGNISNFMSSHAKGNAALSVSLTAMATLSAIVLTPLNFSFWGSMYSNKAALLVPIEIDPLQMFQTVLLLLGIPLILGMLFNQKFPVATEKIKKPIKILSIVIFLAYVVIAFAGNLENFMKYIKYVFLLVLMHNFIAMLTGFALGTFFNVGRQNRRTISIETGIQNSGLALVLIFNPKIFPPELGTGGMAIIAAWWGVWHIISGLVVSSLWSLRKLPKKEIVTQ